MLIGRKLEIAKGRYYYCFIKVLGFVDFQVISLIYCFIFLVENGEQHLNTMQSGPPLIRLRRSY